MMRRPLQFSGRLLLMLVFAVSADHHALARQESAPADLPVPEPEATVAPAEADVHAEPLDLSRLACDALVRQALVSVREHPDPSPLHYRMVALALKLASRHCPGDQERLRLERDALAAAGAEDEAFALTTRIVEMDPEDTVSQLQLVTSRIERLQNADDRLAAYDKLLGDAGRSIDPAVRSRLALDAALVCRETGDEAGFAQRLTLASTLDITNKDAAAMYATYFLPRADDPVARMDILANVILADPGDAASLINLGRELFHLGAYRGARRFLTLSSTVLAATGREPGVYDLLDGYLLIWASEGNDSALEYLQALEDKFLSSLIEQHRAMERIGKDPGEPPTYGLIPAEHEMVRMGIAFARGDTEAMARSAERIGERLTQQRELLDKREGPFANLTDQELAQARSEYVLRLTLARLWAGVELDEAEAEIDAMTAEDAEAPINADAEARLRGLLALRRGDLETAESLLAPLVSKDPTSALAMGMLEEQRGRQSHAVRAYAGLALEYPESLAAITARRRIETLLGKPLAPTEDVVRLEAWAARLAPWLEDYTRNPGSFMSISARHLVPRISVFDRAMVRLSVRNVSRVPLALGPEHPINSRFMLTPRIQMRGEDVSKMVPPEVVDMDRRLRLMPGEELSVDVWVGRARFGGWLELLASEPITVRWRILQGFRYGSGGYFTTAPLCLDTHSDMLTRSSLPSARDFESVVRQVEEAPASGDHRAFLTAVLLAGVNGTIMGDGEADNLSRRTRIAKTVASRLAETTDEVRTYLLPVAVRGGLISAGPEIQDACRDDASPLTKVMMLLIGLPDANDPYPAALLEDTDEIVREMARLYLALVYISEKGGSGRMGEQVNPLETVSTPLDIPAPKEGSELPTDSNVKPVP